MRSAYSNQLKTVFFLCLIFLMGSCKEQEQELFTKPYLPLEIGNYWVFEVFEVDEFGRRFYFDRIDSLYISKQVIYNGLSYYELKGPLDIEAEESFSTLLRNEGNMVVDYQGKVWSAPLSEDEEVQHTLSFDTYDINYSMKTFEKRITVEAGSYDALNFQGVFIDNSSAEIIGFHNLFYGPCVGLVTETKYNIDRHTTLVRELTSYHVN